MAESDKSQFLNLVWHHLYPYGQISFLDDRYILIVRKTVPFAIHISDATMANVQVEAYEYYLSLSFRKRKEAIEKTSEELSALFAGLSHESAVETLQNFVTKLQILLIADFLPEGVSKYYELHKLTVNCHDAKAEKILSAEERAFQATLHGKALNELWHDQIYAEKFRKRISESVSRLETPTCYMTLTKP